MKKLMGCASAGLLLVLSCLVAGAAVDAVRGATPPAEAARAAKVTICHRTNATTNPYRRITVSSNSITKNKGHKDHDGQQNNQFGPFDPTFNYPNSAKNWADIIPGGDADGQQFNGATNLAQNWTAAGKAFMLSGGANVRYCRKMSAKEFYDIEKAAGTPEADILADLTEQGASDDAALKLACGGSFTNCNPTSWATLASATTNAPTALTSDGGTLNGEVKCGTAANTKWYFEYSTSSTLASGVTQVPATPGSVTTSPQTTSHVLTQLVSGTNYYYRVVCVTDYGGTEEGYLEGGIKVLGVGVPFITTTSLLDGVVGDSYTDIVESDGGTAPRVNYRLSPSDPGALPPGLALDSNGQITGTPTQAGLFTIRVIVTDSAGTPLDSAPQELTIRVRRPQTVTIPDPSPKTYGDDPFDGGITSNAEADDDGVVGEFTSYESSTPDVCTISSTGQVTILAAGECTISASHSGNGNWTPGSNTRTFTVAPRPLVIRADDKSKVVDGTNPTMTFKLTSGTLVGSDAISGVTYTFSNSTYLASTTIPNVVGTYVIAPSSAVFSSGSSRNYAISYDDGTLTVTALSGVTPSALGRVIGEVWFDMNKNNKRESNEPLLPGLPVLLESTPTAASASARGSVKRFASTVTTDANGGFDFSSLAPGSYSIRGNLPDDTGISKSWDSDGSADWSVKVVVVANQTKRGDLAGIGDAGFIGQVTGGSNGSAIPGAEVTAAWAGFDKKLGNSDDVEFTVKANSKGAYNLTGIPIGKFAVTAVDPVTKAVAAQQTVTLTSAATKPAARPTVVIAVVPKGLPATGRDGTRPMTLALVLLIGGLAATVATRRRRGSLR